MYSVWQCIHSMFKMEASICTVSGSAYTVCSKWRLRYVQCLALQTQYVQKGGLDTYSVWHCKHSMFQKEFLICTVSGSAYIVCSKRRPRYVQCLALQTQNVQKEGVWVAEWLALPILNHKVQGSNSAGGRIQLMTVQHFIAHSLSLSSPHPLSRT